MSIQSVIIKNLNFIVESFHANQHMKVQFST